MPFSEEERKEAIKGIGSTFVTRLEQMGLDSIGRLADTSEFIVEQGAEITRSSCYKTVRKPEKRPRQLSAGQKKNQAGSLGCKPGQTVQFPENAGSRPQIAATDK